MKLDFPVEIPPVIPMAGIGSGPVFLYLFRFVCQAPILIEVSAA
jgi:hypothetical protein